MADRSALRFVTATKLQRIEVMMNVSDWTKYRDGQYHNTLRYRLGIAKNRLAFKVACLVNGKRPSDVSTIEFRSA